MYKIPIRANCGGIEQTTDYTVHSHLLYTNTIIATASYLDIAQDINFCDENCFAWKLVSCKNAFFNWTDVNNFGLNINSNTNPKNIYKKITTCYKQKRISTQTTIILQKLVPFHVAFPGHSSKNGKYFNIKQFSLGMVMAYSSSRSQTTNWRAVRLV